MVQINTSSARRLFKTNPGHEIAGTCRENIRNAAEKCNLAPRQTVEQQAASIVTRFYKSVPQFTRAGLIEHVPAPRDSEVLQDVISPAGRVGAYRIRLPFTGALEYFDALDPQGFVGTSISAVVTAGEIVSTIGFERSMMDAAADQIKKFEADCIRVLDRLRDSFECDDHYGRRAITQMAVDILYQKRADAEAAERALRR